MDSALDSCLFEKRVAAWATRLKRIGERVHSQLWGHSESVVQRALAYELAQLPMTSVLVEVTQPVEYTAADATRIVVGSVRFDLLVNVGWATFVVEVKVQGGGGSRWTARGVANQLDKYKRIMNKPTQRIILASFAKEGVTVTVHK